MVNGVIEGSERIKRFLYSVHKPNRDISKPLYDVTI